MAQSTVSKYVFGYAMVHPGIFCSALLSSILIKISAEKLKDQSFDLLIEAAADDFALVASNLHNEYLAASRAVANCFMTGD